MTGPMTPGRAVDIVHAAVLEAGLTPFRIEFRFRYPWRGVSVLLNGQTVEEQARKVFAVLGGEHAELSEPYGPDDELQASLQGLVPALDGLALSVLVTSGLRPGRLEAEGPAGSAVEADEVGR